MRAGCWLEWSIIGGGWAAVFRQNVWVTCTEVSKWLILITGQLNSSLLLTVSHAIYNVLLLLIFLHMTVNTQIYAHITCKIVNNTNSQGVTAWKNNLCIITCLDRAHTTQLFNTLVVSPKSFSFPQGLIGFFANSPYASLFYTASHMQLYGSAGHLGTAQEYDGWMVSYNKPVSSTSSALSSSCCSSILPTLQLLSASSLPASLAAIFNTDRATNQAFFSSTVAFHPQQVLPSFSSLSFALCSLWLGAFGFLIFLWCCKM